MADVIASARVRQAVSARLAGHNTAYPGSSTAVVRARLLDAPPSLERREITDKGSLNQRAVLENRSAAVDALYATSGDELLC
jgi:feruloyl-CoA synthase